MGGVCVCLLCKAVPVGAGVRLGPGRPWPGVAVLGSAVLGIVRARVPPPRPDTACKAGQPICVASVIDANKLSKPCFLQYLLQKRLSVMATTKIRDPMHGGFSRH